MIVHVSFAAGNKYLEALYLDSSGSVWTLKTEPSAQPFSGGEVGGKQGLHTEPNVFLVPFITCDSQISALPQTYVMYVWNTHVCSVMNVWIKLRAPLPSSVKLQSSITFCIAT